MVQENSQWKVEKRVELCWALFLAFFLHLGFAVCWRWFAVDVPKEGSDQVLMVNFIWELRTKGNWNQSKDLVKKRKKKYFKSAFLTSKQKGSALKKMQELGSKGLLSGCLKSKVLQNAALEPKALPLPTPIVDPLVQRRLQAVQNKLDFYWQQARPVRPGRVVLRLKVGRQGELLALWVLEAQGVPVHGPPVQDRPALSTMVSNLVKAASPFQQAAGPGTLVFDCSFVVQ